MLRGPIPTLADGVLIKSNILAAQVADDFLDFNHGNRINPGERFISKINLGSVARRRQFQRPTPPDVIPLRMCWICN